MEKLATTSVYQLGAELRKVFLSTSHFAKLATSVELGRPICKYPSRAQPKHMCTLLILTHTYSYTLVVLIHIRRYSKFVQPPLATATSSQW